MNLTRWRTLALWLIAALVTMATLAAFAQSYRGLYDWAREHGLSGFWAGAWPVQLDVFIAVGELALFVALVDKWPRRARIGAWTVTLIGAAVSVAGNVGHVAGHDIASRLTAAVPPVAAASALFVALTILKWVTRPAKSDTVTAVTPEPVPPVVEPVTMEPVTARKTTAKQEAVILGKSQSTIQRWRRDGSIGERLELAMANERAKNEGVSERTMYRRLAAVNGKAHGED